MPTNPRFCRHCGSPAKTWPCWWRLKERNWEGDPPCYLDAHVDGGHERNRRALLITAAIVLGIAAIYTAAVILI